MTGKIDFRTVLTLLYKYFSVRFAYSCFINSLNRPIGKILGALSLSSTMRAFVI